MGLWEVPGSSPNGNKKKKKKKKWKKKKAIKKIKNKNSKHILADEWFGKTMEEKLQHTSK